MLRKGIILAGGTGSRLGELTRVVNKHLLPVGTWPMVYHPLGKLIAARITDILLTSSPDAIGDFARLLGSGRQHGCSLYLRAQDEAGGIAQALALAETFCAGEGCAVLLGDNIFEDSLTPLLQLAETKPDHAWLALREVDDPRPFGVAEVVNGNIVSLEEKPQRPRGRHAVTGMYLFPADVFDVIRRQQASSRGELEITDVNRHYLEQGRLQYTLLEGYWIDAGTPENLELANRLVKSKSADRCER